MLDLQDRRVGEAKRNPPNADRSKAQLMAVSRVTFPNHRNFRDFSLIYANFCLDFRGKLTGGKKLSMPLRFARLKHISGLFRGFDGLIIALAKQIKPIYSYMSQQCLLSGNSALSSQSICRQSQIRLAVRLKHLEKEGLKWQLSRNGSPLKAPD